MTTRSALILSLLSSYASATTTVYDLHMFKATDFPRAFGRESATKNLSLPLPYLQFLLSLLPTLTFKALLATMERCRDITLIYLLLVAKIGLCFFKEVSNICNIAGYVSLG